MFPTPIAAASPPGHMTGALMATPGKPTHGLTPLLGTPMTRKKGGFHSPNTYANDYWGTPAWGGDDANFLQDYLGSQSKGTPHYSAITPGRSRHSATPFTLDRGTAPRVAFKDQSVGKFNSNTVPVSRPTPVSVSSLLVPVYGQRNSNSHIRLNTCPLLQQPALFAETTDLGTPGTVTTPSRKGAGIVTGSGRERSRSNATFEERDSLLSTAIFNTPKSPAFSSGHDVDQSLHHIDACIKSPLDFGSPTVP
jgi:hypothetical protein